MVFASMKAKIVAIPTAAVFHAIAETPTPAANFATAPTIGAKLIGSGSASAGIGCGIAGEVIGLAWISLY
jgi:hypothetical protein